MVIGKVKVTGTRAETVEVLDIPQGIVGATVSFEFGPEWAGLTKNVVFVGAKDVAFLDIEDTVHLPAEVVAVPNISVKVGVVGVDADNRIVIPTLWADLGTVKHGAPVETGYEPTLPVWAQMLGMIGNLRNLETEAKDNLVAAINEVKRIAEDNGIDIDLSAYVKSVNGVLPDPESGDVAVEIPKYTLPIAGAELGGVKNGGNVVINEDGTMDAPDSSQNPDLTGVVKSVNGVTPDENGNVEISVSGGGTDTAASTVRAIPELRLSGDTTGISKDQKVYLSYVFRDTANGKQRSGWCDLKWQGETSLQFPKKNYKITLYKDPYYGNKDKVDFGFGKQSKYTLKGNYQDKTMVRNVVGCRIWGAVVNTRKNYLEALADTPNHGSTDGFPFNLYLNDEYIGLYTWNTDKSWMTGQDEDNPLHCLMDQDYQVDGFASGAIGAWACEIPDVLTDSLRESFQNVLTFVSTATDEEFVSGIDNYVDLESAIDYLCFIYLMGALDSNGKNQMLMTFDGVKWHMNVYDQDSNLGAHWGGSLDVPTNIAYPDGYQQISNTLLSRIWALFSERIVERYNFLRKTALSLDYITNEIKMFYDAIPQSDVVNNSKKWHNSATDGKSQINYHINWITERAVYVDSQINSLLEGYKPCQGITLSASSLTFDALTEQTLTATVTPEDTSDSIVWSSSDESVCTVNANGVVTPVAGGNAVITARCGSHSATCSVSVSLNAIVWSVTPQYRANGTTGYIYSKEVDGDNSIYDRYKSNEIRLECGKSYEVTLTSYYDDFVLYNSKHEVIHAEENYTAVNKGFTRHFSIPDVVGEDCYLVLLCGHGYFDASGTKIVECPDAVWSASDDMWRILPTGEIRTSWDIDYNLKMHSDANTYWHKNTGWMAMHRIPVSAGQALTIAIAPNAVIAFYAEDGTFISATRNSAVTQAAYSQTAPDNAAYAVCWVRNYGGVSRDTAVITVE